MASIRQTQKINKNIKTYKTDKVIKTKLTKREEK